MKTFLSALAWYGSFVSIGYLINEVHGSIWGFALCSSLMVITEIIVEIKK
jgi:hypothetical protein